MRLFILTVAIILYSGCSSCQFEPHAEDFKVDACFSLADCLYRNADNPDKSFCTGLMSECNAFNKYEYCKKLENRVDNISFKECWLYLNQK